MPKYTKEQIEDIKARELKGIEALKDLDLSPACRPYLNNMGDDTFGFKLMPYLADTKYISPIKKSDV